MLMDTTTIMANMGLGIDPETCLDVVNEILKKRIEIAAFVPVSIGVVMAQSYRNLVMSSPGAFLSLSLSQDVSGMWCPELLLRLTIVITLSPLGFPPVYPPCPQVPLCPS